MTKGCPTLRELVARGLESVPVSAVMSSLERVARYDRYQASSGIHDAARVVMDTAREIGLREVKLREYPADGSTQWWSFAAPVAWTPTTARLEVVRLGQTMLTIDHAQQPFSIATYSAATPPGGVEARLVDYSRASPAAGLQSTLVVIDGSPGPIDELADVLTDAGALGFVTDGPCRIEPPNLEHPGRIELRPGSPLLGFSLTHRQLRQVRALTREGATAHVTVGIDRSTSMPVVTGVLPGHELDGEVWLTAHLCHPRPGANDNASGVAALLGVASVLEEWRREPQSERRRGIRFVWAPEFLGVAATLHDAIETNGRASIPSAVINLDMVGEDQARCLSPLVLEQCAATRPDPISAIAEAVVAEVFDQTADEGGTWHTTPFAGFSDHALFAGPRLWAPAVQLCHVPDRFNHSAADTLDKVSPAEMRRSVAAAAVLSHLLADDTCSAAMLDAIVGRWAQHELADARRIAHEHRAHESGSWSQRRMRYVEDRIAAVREIVGGITPPGGPPRPRTPGGLCGRWQGPFNARAMAQQLPTASRRRLGELIRDDKNNLAILNNLAIRMDGSSTHRQLLYDVSFALGRPVDEATAALLLGFLLESGWIEEVP